MQHQEKKKRTNSPCVFLAYPISFMFLEVQMSGQITIFLLDSLQHMTEIINISVV